MIRRPRDAKQAMEFISKAHSDMRNVVIENENGSAYEQFWKGLDILMKSSFFVNLDKNYKASIFSQVVINVGCPIFERTIREHEVFEDNVEIGKKNKKFKSRVLKFESFVKLVKESSQICLERNDIDDTLRSIAKDCHEMFLQNEVVNCVYFIFISSRNFRRIIRLLSRRVEPTFCVNKRFGESDPMDATEADQILSTL